MEPRQILNCPVCGARFERHVAHSRRVQASYCSPACAYIAHRKTVTNLCVVCGKPFKVVPSIAKRVVACSPTCSSANRKARGNPKVRIHGLSDSPTQWVWSDMKRRCLAPGRRGYKNYGGRGILICDRWINGDGKRSGFECFLVDLGARPSPDHQLDRIDNDGHYTPENCRWVHRDGQNYNKRNTYRFTVFGVEHTLKSAEEAFGIPRGTIWRRLQYSGMPASEAVTKPVRRVQKR